MILEFLRVGRQRIFDLGFVVLRRNWSGIELHQATEIKFEI